MAVSNSGSQTEPVVENLIPVWTAPTGARGPLAVAPMVAGDRLICTTSAQVYARDIYTGTEIVAPNATTRPGAGFPQPLRLGFGETMPRPAVGDDAIYYVQHHTLVAFQISDGRPKAGWTPPVVGRLVSIEANEGVVVLCHITAAGQPQVAGYDMQSGKLAWGPHNISEHLPGPAAVGDDAVFFVGDGSLIAINTRSGDQRFTFAPASDTGTSPTPLGTIVAPSVADLGDRSMVITVGHKVYGVDARRGAQLWDYPSNEPAPNTAWLAPVIDVEHELAVIANQQGEISGVDVLSGTVKWTKTLTSAAQPILAPNVVYVADQSQAGMLYVLDLTTGQTLHRYNLGDTSSAELGIVIGRAMAFVPAAAGLQALELGTQEAARFDGLATTVKIEADKSEFDFGTDDFTVETWVCTTAAGEVISGYPTLPGSSEHHGYRVNLTDTGEIRFAVLNPDCTNVYAAMTGPTPIADGSWHHLAVVRRAATVEIYLDGISRKVYDNRSGTAPLAIQGNLALTLGAFAPQGAPADPQHFEGLMRELRIWSTGVEATTLQSRMWRELTGMEPHLLGYWRLDRAAGNTIKNEVLAHTYAATPTNLNYVLSDLELDITGFPYLLDVEHLRWPYLAGRWAARGDAQIAFDPVMTDDGTICFGSEDQLYGISRIDGKRAWSIDREPADSAPVPVGNELYVLTAREGLIAIASSNGKSRQLTAFNGLLTQDVETGPRLTAPACDGRWTAAASPAGLVRIYDNRLAPEDPRASWTWSNPEGIAPAEMKLADGLLWAVAGSRLYRLDPNARAADVASNVSAPLVVAGGRVVCASTDRKQLISFQSNTLDSTGFSYSLSNGASAIGLAADANLDGLIVTTDQGDVIGMTLTRLSQRWSKPMPMLSGGTPQPLNPPEIVQDGAICTSRAGVIAAFDVLTGDVWGWLSEPHPIVTKPLPYAGGIYFGCADAPPDSQKLDGALHAVVMGDVHALRLGLDCFGNREAANGYASIATGDARHLMDVRDCAVEAWINTSWGGEILSICPNTAGSFGLRFWVESTGAIHFVAYDQPSGAWERVEAHTGATGACDGMWHHVAVVRGDRIRIFLDGTEILSTVDASGASTPAVIADSLRVYLGADSSSAVPAPESYFYGLIGEVRVWDTYLTPHEISDRMHTKLLGIEQDLIAYWNFDRFGEHNVDSVGIFDSTPYKHDGVLVTNGGSAGYWLSDLSFTLPNYPHLETRATKATVVDASGQTQHAYDLTIIAKAADGSPLRTALSLWYVREPWEPATTVDVSGAASGTLRVVESSHEDDADKLTARTGPDGRAKFRLIFPDENHGPAIDVWADFMQPNERFHVTVMLDAQRLAASPPPRLEAQSSLIQDYHWKTGDQVNENRDRSTYRTIIKALNADNTPCPHVPIRLWSEDHMEIEIAGSVSSISPQNHVELALDELGELTVVVGAGDLTAPALSVWAGFMHANERFTIPVDQDAHQKLANIQSNDLTDKKMTNWHPGHDASQDRSLASDDMHDGAPSVAAGVRHVMAPTQASAQKPASRPALGASPNAVDSPLHSAMRQPPPPGFGNQVRSVRTMRHIGRGLPIDSEAFAASLNSDPAMRGAAGFVISRSPSNGSISMQPITGPDHLAQLLDRPSAPKPPLGGFFDDVWDDIKGAAESVADVVHNVVVTIGEQVKAYIQFAVHQLEVVVDGIKQAIAVVKNIFDLIAAEIEKVIAFLRLLFDWGAILRLHRIFRDHAHSALNTAFSLPKFKDEIFEAFSTVAQTLSGNAALPDTLASSTLNSQQNAAQAAVHSQSDSVHGKYVTSKTRDGSDRIDTSKLAPAPHSAPPAPAEDSASGVVALIQDITQLMQDPLNLSVSDLVTSAKSLTSGKGLDLSSLVADSIGLLIPNPDIAKRAVLGALEGEIYVPFLSDLYKFITGDTLTILDVTCLAIAIPAHIGYGIFTALFRGGARELADDLEPLSQNLVAAETSASLLSWRRTSHPLLGNGNNAFSPDFGANFSYCLFSTLHALTLPTRRVSEIAPYLPPGAVNVSLTGTGQKVFILFNAVCSIVANCVFLKAYVDDLDSYLPGREAEVDALKPMYGIFFTQAVLTDIYYAYESIRGVAPVVPDPAAIAGAPPPVSKVDIVAVVFSILGLGNLIYRSVVFGKWGKDDPDSAKASFARDLLSCIKAILDLSSASRFEASFPRVSGVMGLIEAAAEIGAVGSHVEMLLQIRQGN